MSPLGCYPLSELNLSLHLSTNSMEPDENDSDEIDFTQQLGERQNHHVYLITYSQADLEKVKDCKKFSDCSLEAFAQNESTCIPEHWSYYYMEEHQDGANIITLPSS